jgi:hypothetical protein
MFGLAVLASLYWAMRWPMPWSVRAYLLAQFVYVPPIWLAHYLWGDASKVYSWVFWLSTVPILAAMGYIVLEVLSARRHPYLALACAFNLALAFTRMAYLDLHRPMIADDWLVLAKALVLLWAGILLAYAAARDKHWDVSLILALLWLAQGVYDIGWEIGWPMWNSLNWIVPAWTGIIGFLLLGWRFRAEVRSTRLAGHLQ